jgi:dTDP-4-dehydrorhamnose 3,5-epimerase
MLIKESKIKGVFEITLEPQVDNRGLFMRTYDEKIFGESGLNRIWVQENHSYSRKKGTLRGLHFQFPPRAEVKLVRAVRGEIFMAYVDIRKGSPTFGKWESLVLSENNLKVLYVTRGIALGMCTLTDNCTLLYKMGDYYVPESQGTIKWNDPDIGIKWPTDKPIISEKDTAAMRFKDFIAKYKGLEV